ncbi:MAG: ribosome biogenesis factor YjgA [Burkholderiaceae bacterium]|jgi:ribosome-associated protein
MTEAIIRQDDKPSKSQLKREMHQLQAYGKILVSLNDSEFRKVQLPERLHDAVVACRMIKAHEAKRRQLQYVGRLMRELDETSLVAVLKQISPNASISSGVKRRDIQS